MSSFVLTAPSADVDPALRAGVLSELDAAIAGLDDLASTLTALRDACAWESDGVEALRWALWRLSDDTATVRRTLQACRGEVEGA
ncbi:MULTISPECIES: hypothetical protein [Microbacterium]|uniref:HNH endonuclease n=1 Tax=Microbacterium paraoxydans TaxID=199592 RepID=A0ABZ2HWH2_9MICO|nr:hypothetical protein [Microbacterium paraoxydans]QXE29847.1 hypothetical protein IZR02_16115 [Microbacterium paraoxydans]